MNKSTIIGFALGAIAGSVGTWFFAKKKYEQIAQEEIYQVREYYSERDDEKGVEGEPTGDDDEDPKKKVAELARNKDAISSYNKIVEENEYKVQHSNIFDTQAKDKGKPYVIKPEEFGDIDDYELVELTYYSDLVLAEMETEEIIDVDEVVGGDSLLTFGQYDDDIVYVRNDRLMCDYKIVVDNREFSEVEDE